LAGASARAGTGASPAIKVHRAKNAAVRPKVRLLIAVLLLSRFPAFARQKALRSPMRRRADRDLRNGRRLEIRRSDLLAMTGRNATRHPHPGVDRSFTCSGRPITICECMFYYSAHLVKHDLASTPAAEMIWSILLTIKCALHRLKSAALFDRQYNSAMKNVQA
jgi:hypothetical protein